MGSAPDSLDSIDLPTELRAALAIVRDANREELKTLTPLMLQLQRPLPLVNGMQALVRTLFTIRLSKVTHPAVVNIFGTETVRCQ